MVLLALNELNHFLPQPRDRCCTKRPPCFRLKPEPTLFRNSWASYHTAEQRSSTVLDWWRALHYTHPFGEGGCKTDDKLKTYWQSNNWTELYLYVWLTRLAKVQSLLHYSGQKPRAVQGSHQSEPPDFHPITKSIGYQLFPRLAAVKRFPALGSCRMLFRAWMRSHVFPRLVAVACFFPRLVPVACFPALGKRVVDSSHVFASFRFWLGNFAILLWLVSCVSLHSWLQ